MSESGSELEEQEGAESEVSEVEEEEKVIEKPWPMFSPRPVDPLTQAMNINWELDMLGTNINWTCTALKYGEYGKGYQH